MNPSRRGALCAALLWPGLALAQAAAADPPATEVRGGEPNVKRSVIEDDGSRIEELRVRGQARSVVITTKGPLASSYEINVGDPSREMDATADTRRGAAGHSMWRVFSF
jgi:hypothetical protein